MTKSKYSRVGNLGKNYSDERRLAVPLSLITDPNFNLVLKRYVMIKDGGNMPSRQITQARSFLKTRIKYGLEPALAGLGFAILSEGMLNVAMWTKGSPSILKNSIYEYDAKRETFGDSVDIRTEGAFCVWELGIVAHEREAWKRFLMSERKESDKKQYLDDMIQGYL